MDSDQPKLTFLLRIKQTYPTSYSGKKLSARIDKLSKDAPSIKK